MSEKYYHTKESVEQYIKMAEGYNGKHLIDELSNYMSGSDILELGSGPGTDWEYLSNKYAVTGSDNSDEFLNHLKTKYPKGNFLKINAESLLTENTFDAIYSNKVLHHIGNQELNQSLKRQFEVLRPKGLVCHSFWKGEGTETYHGMYVNYHSENSLKVLFEQFFEILCLESYKEFDNDDSIYIIARKK